MNDDLNYKKEYELIVCDEKRIEQLLKGQREKVKFEEERKFIEISYYILVALLTISLVLEFGYGVITRRFYHVNVISGDIYSMFVAFCTGNYLFINMGIYGALQYYIMDIVKIIPSKIVCVIASLVMCFVSISLEKLVLIDTLLKIKDVPIVYYFFLLYCISIIGYFFLGVFTLFAEDLDEHLMRKHPVEKKTSISEIYKEKLKESINIYVYIVILVICYIAHSFI